MNFHRDGRGGRVTSWWHDSGAWCRYYGRANARVVKGGKGLYRATVSTPERGNVWEGVAGTAAAAKRDTDAWLRNNGDAFA
jgi:hypothetical protein